MEDLYAKEDEDNPFEANEIRFWSAKTMFKFLLVGLPRLLLILVYYIIILILSFTMTTEVSDYNNYLSKYMSILKMYLYGYKNFRIDEKTKNIIKNSKAQIIVANHASYCDAFFLIHLFPDAKFIVSDFIANVPIIKTVINYRSIYLTSDFSGNLTDKIQEYLNKGRRIVFFSEGVCKNPKLLLKLRNGAFVPRMNILPIHIDYDNDAYYVAGEQDMIRHILHYSAIRRKNVYVRALDEYILSEEDKTGDIEVFKENFRKYYAKGFGIKLSRKNYLDQPYYKMKKMENEKVEKN